MVGDNCFALDNASGHKREGEAPAEPGLSSKLRLGRSLALPESRLSLLTAAETVR